MLLFFEVSDKIEPLTVIWPMFFALGFAGGLLAYWKWPLVIVSVLPTAALAWFYLTEAYDPMINAAIESEVPHYISAIWASVIFSFSAPVAGLLMHIRQYDKLHPPELK